MGGSEVVSGNRSEAPRKCEAAFVYITLVCVRRDALNSLQKDPMDMRTDEILMPCFEISRHKLYESYRVIQVVRFD